MKAMVFGTVLMVEELGSLLVEEGLEVASTSDTFQAVNLMMDGGIDLVILDGSLQDSETLGHCLGQLANVSVVLAVDNKQNDWERLRSLDIDGYIPDGAGKAEAMARIRAVVRRRFVGVKKPWWNEQFSFGVTVK